MQHFRSSEHSRKKLKRNRQTDWYQISHKSGEKHAKESMQFCASRENRTAKKGERKQHSFLSILHAPPRHSFFRMLPCFVGPVQK
mmetsp:Transcript_30858/g.60778  ORF Transcript_30858/g.60778 Transcript_30858/m.60778 type:complete len:85 (+) Transcript_30858:140-394(+)